MIIKSVLKINILLIVYIIIFLSSCDKKSITSWDDNIKELIDWSLAEDQKYNNPTYTPILSSTLEELVALDNEELINKPEKGVILGYFNFKKNKAILTDSNKDLLILIAKAQKFENFNIIIQSNDIKSKYAMVMNEIEKILLSSGVKNNKISLNSLSDGNKDFIIKVIKL